MNTMSHDYNEYGVDILMVNLMSSLLGLMMQSVN